MPITIVRLVHRLSLNLGLIANCLGLPKPAKNVFTFYPGQLVYMSQDFNYIVFIIKICLDNNAGISEVK